MKIHSKDNALSFLLFPCHFGCFLGFFSGWVVWLGFFPQLGSDCHVFFCIYLFLK